jgi:hypothetical protein
MNFLEYQNSDHGFHTPLGQCNRHIVQYSVQAALQLYFPELHSPSMPEKEESLI